MWGLNLILGYPQSETVLGHASVYQYYWHLRTVTWFKKKTRYEWRACLKNGNNWFGNCKEKNQGFSTVYHFWFFVMFYCFAFVLLFYYIVFSSHSRIFSLKLRSDHYRLRASNYNLYSALMAISNSEGSLACQTYCVIR